MDPVTIGLLAGAGIGAVKGGVLDRQKEERQRQRDAELARWSPWSGIGPQGIQEADMLGSTMQGAMGGAMLGSNIPGGGGGAATAAGGASGGGAAGTPLAAGYGGQDMSSAYRMTPAMQAARTPQGFQQYAQQQYFNPWTQM